MVQVEEVIFFNGQHTFVQLENYEISLQRSVYLLFKRERL